MHMFERSASPRGLGATAELHSNKIPHFFLYDCNGNLSAISLKVINHNQELIHIDTLPHTKDDLKVIQDYRIII